MRTPYNPNQNPRVIIIQKLYGKFFNDDEDITFSKHRFKKSIKDVVLGTIERDDVIKEEVRNYLSEDLELSNMDKVFPCLNMRQAIARKKKGREAALAVTSVLSQ